MSCPERRRGSLPRPFSRAWVRLRAKKRPARTRAHSPRRCDLRYVRRSQLAHRREPESCVSDARIPEPEQSTASFLASHLPRAVATGFRTAAAAIATMPSRKRRMRRSNSDRPHGNRSLRATPQRGRDPAHAEDAGVASRTEERHTPARASLIGLSRRSWRFAAESRSAHTTSLARGFHSHRPSPHARAAFPCSGSTRRSR